MRLALSSEMREIDRRTIEEFGVPGIVLMENAGLAVLHILKQFFAVGSDGGSCFKGRSFLIICGPGNNGGDGFVIGRHLYNLGAEVTAVLAAPPDRYRGDALINFRAYEALVRDDLQGPHFMYCGEDGTIETNLFCILLAKSDMVIDAVYGTGFTGELPEPVQQISQETCRSGKPVLSVDIPSGVDADTGRVSKGAFKADITVTFALSKPGLEVYPGKEFAGSVKRAYIGIPDILLESDMLHFNVLTEKEAKEMLPKRPATAHKGTFGRSLVVAGSTGMTGASYLSATAALLTGSGLVTLCIPKSLNHILEEKTTEVMTLPCPETAEGTFSKQAAEVITSQIQTSNAVILGPGLGRNSELSYFVEDIINSCKIPVLLDADGLFNLNTASLCRLGSKGIIPVLTPHPGEMARLTGLSIGEIESDRIKVAVSFAREWNSIVLLKGAATIIAEPGGRVYINPTGNPGMASGGVGDVLSGIIGSFLTQGVDPFSSAVLGAYMHGLAGDLALQETGMASLTAGTLLQYIPKAFIQILSEGTAVR